MGNEALALVALFGVAAWLASRSGSAGAATYQGGGSIPFVPFAPSFDPYAGNAPQSGYVDAYGEPAESAYAWGDDYSVQPGASWTVPAGTPYVDPYASAYDHEIGGDVTTPSGDPGANLAAMLALIRAVEPGPGQYQAIAGVRGPAFSDMSEHPFILNPTRTRPLGTTASGAYQMVVGTWKMARDALGLPDFSPASQDRAAAWIIQYKRPASYPYVISGQFLRALAALRNEWEAFDKMLVGTYPVTLAQAQGIFESAGGTIT